MKAIVTGTRGFIGGALLQKLVSEGHEVKPIYHDNLDFEAFVPDIVFHVAGVSPHLEGASSLQLYTGNVDMTRNLLEMVRVVRPVFVYVSTSSVYGQRIEPMNEWMRPDPASMYAATKAAAEDLVQGFHQEYGLPTVVVRPFSVYGPGEANYRFIPTIIRGMMAGETIPLVSEPMHDWIFIQDLVDGLVSFSQTIAAYGEIVNLGTGSQTSNGEVVKALSYIANKGIKTTPYGVKKPNDDFNWVADTKKMERLGFKPKYDLAKGLYETYEYFKHELEKKNS